MQIYLASSWRNTKQPIMVNELRKAGFGVYDFRNPRPGNVGFHWKETGLVCDGDGLTTTEQLWKAYWHPIAEEGFRLDYRAMEMADVFVLLLPCGRSAHLEAGWAIGRAKPLFVYMEYGELHVPELMYKMAGPGVLVGSLDELIARLDILVEDWSQR